MILIDAADRSPASLDVCAILAAKLADLGHAVGIDASAVSGNQSTDHRHLLAPLLVDVGDIEISRVLIVAGASVSDDMLATLQSYDLPPDIPVQAIGRLGAGQARIDLRLRLAYALGREAELVEADPWQGRVESSASTTALACSEVAARPRADSRLRLTIVLSGELIDDPQTLPALSALSHQRKLRLRLVAPSELRKAIVDVRLAEFEVYGLEELLPQTLAAMTDIAVFIGAAVPGGWVAAFGLDMMQSGRVVIDSTATPLFLRAGAPALQGPAHLSALAVYLDQTVLPNLEEIRRQTAGSPWLAATSVRHLAQKLGLPEVAPPPPRDRPHTVFLPTNGIGLGHAQRCLQIARQIGGTDIGFAAFPSCLPMIEAAGFPCLPLVQRSGDHPDRSGNDLLNGLRLRRNLQPGDTLVFDGGYVFPSVYRTILEKDLTGVWIRRGLWQPGQVTAASLQRETVFRAVIVPSEAFDELNEDYTFGPRVTRTGPIVQHSTRTAAERAALRQRLGERFGIDLRQLVVTMLGGGIAADRVAQTQVVCNAVEGRPGCLHLVVVWPGSRVSPALQGWQNTVVVQTRQACDLCVSADLVVSAAGYNSFHECLYHAVPAIFVPQMAPFMDDQERRARAAADRGAAVAVAANDLFTLGNEIALCLDNGKATELGTALRALSLPERGTARAAEVIRGLAA